ncbi:acyltransferase family protein [Gluconacetobacter entanii]|uniref:acyltransferase family protein n=1 Tax=Gluconacetobacter entanii TaxID=108528 RepID=UPI0022366EA9|nr:hypothetical protein [Gluconacetobacter entanii]MCW4581606.1 hypothetical protein [Gluconacetobacter entanii]
MAAGRKWRDGLREEFFPRDRRRDIDGLRALAVAAVMLMHAGWLSGGFVGVDIFVVVSGYFMGRSALMQDSFQPALLCMVAAISAGMLWWVLQSDRTDIALNGAYALLGILAVSAGCSLHDHLAGDGLGYYRITDRMWEFALGTLIWMLLRPRLSRAVAASMKRWSRMCRGRSQRRARADDRQCVHRPQHAPGRAGSAGARGKPDPRPAAVGDAVLCRAVPAGT